MSEARQTSDAPPGAAPSPRGARRAHVLISTLLIINALVSLALGIRMISRGRAETAGLLASVLPWTGLAAYGALAFMELRAMSSSVAAQLLGLCIFTHACLITESLVLGVVCAGCLTTAGIAFAVGLVQAFRRPATRLTLGLSLVLGITSGPFLPFERVDDRITRALWPARILNQLPAFIDPKELAGRCSDGSPVRLDVYENEESCRTCTGMGRKVLPLVAREFPASVCVHRHFLTDPPGDGRLPMLVLSSRKARLIIIEGTPAFEDLRSRINLLLSESDPAPNQK